MTWVWYQYMKHMELVKFGFQLGFYPFFNFEITFYEDFTEYDAPLIHL
jgi:hypothetical protein